MEQFEFKIDTSTIWIKAIRALGFLAIGFTIGAISFTYKYGEPINWVGVFILMGCGLNFAFFPGFGKQPSLIFSENGITFQDSQYPYETNKEIAWEKISEIRIDRTQVYIKKTIGSSEQIKLPLYTKDQIAGLKSYLKEITSAKEVTYLG